MTTGYPPAPQVPPAPMPPAPAAPPATSAGNTNGRLFVTIFGSVAVALTVVAVLLATVGQFIFPSNTPNVDGWTKIYDADLHGSAANWKLTGGCTTRADGLHADAEAGCVFEPSNFSDLTSDGFYFKVELAPGAAVPSLEAAFINVNDNIEIDVDQTGNYAICFADGCTAGGLFSSNTTNGSEADGTADAWHGSSYSPNTIGMLVSADGTQMEFFANDHLVASIPIHFHSGAVITIGALYESEALFTHATLYSGSATALPPA